MLSDDQLSLLKRAVQQYAPGLISLTLLDVSKLPLDQRNQLRAALGDYLVGSGFDEDWNPTLVGIEIEHLIDVLGPR